MPADAKARLIDNIVTSMRSVPERIQRKQIEHFLKPIRRTGRVWRMGWG
jgi:hypothetical protein